jgi:hypothetical protein
MGMNFGRVSPFGKPYGITFLVLCAALAFVISACSKVATHDTQLFYGECKVTVTAQPEDAHILIDGIPVGHKESSVNIPCGSKQILVEQHGYVPYYAYHDVGAAKPLSVSVKLEKLKKIPEYALSQELLAQVRTGKRLKNPFLISNEEGVVPETEETAEVDPALLGSDGGSDAASPSMPAGDINSVDYWR